MTHKQQKGFALLYALLVTTITLSASLIVSSIITRQLKTSNIGSRGFVAYASAYDGYRCAFFWDTWARDKKHLADGLLGTIPSGVASCFGQSLNFQIVASNIPSECTGYTTKKQSFLLSPTDRTSISPQSDPMVDVFICLDSNNETVIISQGWDTGNSADPRRVFKIIRSI